MARKALLTENEIRKFMKLARIGPVGETRLQEMGVFGERDEDEELEDELHATEDELGAEDHMADEEGDALDDLAMEPDGLDGDVEVGGGELDAELEDMLAQGVEALATAWGIEDRVDVEGGEGGEEELGEPLPDEEEVAMDVGIEDVGIEDTGEEVVVGAEEEELPGMRSYDENQIVQEVAKRVVARLSRRQKKEDLSEQLADRILQRLTAK